MGCGPALRNPHDHGGGMVDEYRPAWKPVEHAAPGSGVYVLWRWQAVPAVVPTVPPSTELLAAAATTRPAARPSPRRRWERAIELEQVFVRRGQPVGFRRRPDGLLVGVAGPTTRPLDPGHYCWHLLPGNPTIEGQTHYAGSSGSGVRDVFVVGGIVAAVAGAWEALTAIDHNDGHAHVRHNVVDTLLDGPDAGD